MGKFSAPSKGAKPTESKPIEHNEPAEANDNRKIVLDDARLKALGMISKANDNQSRMVKDEFRVIKHKLINNAFGVGSESLQTGNMVMVSSAKPNEGKTHVAINLALSIASEKEKTVLLADADVLNPSIAESLEFDESMPGLIDYLLGDVENVSDIIYPTSVPDLRIMPAGSAHHLSYELLSSDRMTALMDELATRYPDRMIVLDCPPLLGVVETVTLSSMMGQAAVVVEQNKTKMADVKQAVSMLNSDMAIGFVINKAVHGADSGYGYGYGYGGYGYGSSSKRKKK